jgi:hypothetical protein
MGALVELPCTCGSSPPSDVQSRGALVDAALARWQGGTADGSANAVGAAEAEGLLALLALQVGALPWPDRSRRWYLLRPAPGSSAASLAAPVAAASSLPLPVGPGATLWLSDLATAAAAWPGASSVRQAAADLAVAALFGHSKPSAALLAAAASHRPPFAPPALAALGGAQLLAAEPCRAAFAFARGLADRSAAQLAAQSADPQPPTLSAAQSAVQTPVGPAAPAATPVAAPAAPAAASTLPTTRSPAAAAAEEGWLLCQDAVFGELLVHALVLQRFEDVVQPPFQTPAASVSAARGETEGEGLGSCVASAALLRVELASTLWKGCDGSSGSGGGGGAAWGHGLWGQVARSLNPDKSFEVGNHSSGDEFAAAVVSHLCLMASRCVPTYLLACLLLRCSLFSCVSVDVSHQGASS